LDLGCCSTRFCDREDTEQRITLRTTCACGTYVPNPCPQPSVTCSSFIEWSELCLIRNEVLLSIPNTLTAIVTSARMRSMQILVAAGFRSDLEVTYFAWVNSNSEQKSFTTRQVRELNISSLPFPSIFTSNNMRQLSYSSEWLSTPSPHLPCPSPPLHQ
jgi:hypothetical protein